MSTTLSVIPKIGRVYKTTFANLPTTSVKTEALGYATDRKIFYRWSGSAWEPLTTYIGYGLASAKPAAATLPNGCLYQETDTYKLMEVQAGAWVCIFYSGSGTAVNKPAVGGMPEGALYSETDTHKRMIVQSGAWVCIFFSGSGVAANIPAAAGMPEGALYLETDTSKLRQIQSGAWVVIVDPDAYGYGGLTVAGFQQNPGTGTCDNPGGINDDNFTTQAGFDVIDEYAQVEFLEVVYIGQFRQYGHDSNNGDGSYRIEYQDQNGTWHTWKAGIPSKDSAAWTAWDNSGGVVAARAIKIVCTAVDSGAADSIIKELEVKL